MAIALRYAARSDVGLGRYKNNQDSGYAGPHLLVVADGMGGHAGGDVASSMIVGEVAALDGEAHGGDDALDHLQSAILDANADVVRRARADPDPARMGTTVTALLRSGSRLALAHIGDSRAYLLHEGELEQVTADHTFVQMLVDQGRITRDQAERHPQRSVIMRVLGDVGAEPQLDTSVREAVVGDRWLLCSDGLSGVISDETLADTLRDVEDPGACADTLLELALRAGAPDNVTLIVADVVDVSSRPPSSPQAVGAVAAVQARAGGSGTSAAARAAALSRRHGAPDGGPDGDDEADGDDEEGDRRRGLTLAVAVLAVVALLAAGSLGAWAWGRQQYFVGASGENVAIFRGLQQDLGPVPLSRVFAEQDLRTESLPAFWRRQVEARIGADDVGHAERIVAELRQRSQECQAALAAARTAEDDAAGAPPTPAPSATGPGAAPTVPGPRATSPGATRPGTRSPGATGPTVAPSATAQAPEPALPVGCEEGAP
jgi:PPM family protein phosphatase